MPALDWSRYRALSGLGDETDAARLCDSPAADDRAMGEALARDHAQFVPHGYDDCTPLWVVLLGGAVWAWIILVSIATAIGVLWLLMWHVLPAIPWAAALLIQTGGRVLWGL